MNIDFYVLDTTSGQKCQFFACELIQKAHAEEQQIYVHVNSREEAERFDALLWTFSEDSFIPHNIYSAADTLPPAIQIGYGETPQNHTGTLINLSAEIPAFFTQFKQVVEIVFSDPSVQQLARERFRQYRDQGHEINTHKLKA